MKPEKFNPYTNPDLLRSLEQEKLRKAQREQIEQRRSFVDAKHIEAMDIADKGIVVTYNLWDRSKIEVFQKNEAISPQVGQIENQEPIGQ